MTITHPLLERRTESAHPTWETNLTVGGLPYLTDHCVQGSIVYPGAAYVEMALTAAMQLDDHTPVVLENVEFKRALTLTKDETQQLQFIFDANHEAFWIYSRPQEGAQEWLLHATGNLAPKREAPAAKVADLASLQSRCKKQRSRESFYVAMKARALQYGPCFQGVETMWHGDQEGLGRIQLADGVLSGLESYVLHPALLDACFQILIGAAFTGADEQESSGACLPVRIARLVFHKKPRSGALWTYGKVITLSASTLEGDLVVLGEDGEVIVEISGFGCRILPNTKPAADLSKHLHEISWFPTPLIESGSVPAVAGAGGGRWVILADRGGVGQSVANGLQERGGAPILVAVGQSYAATDDGHFEVRPESPDDMMALFQAAGDAIQGVVHLWSLEIPKPEDSGLAGLELAQQLGCISTMHLVQALAKGAGPERPRLWLVTRGAQAVPPKVDSVMVAQAPIWGLGRVLGNEQTDLRCTMLDLDPDAADVSGTLLDELCSGDPEQEVAWRNGLRYAARLTRPPTPAARSKAAGDGETASYRLEPAKSTLGSLRLIEDVRRKPGPDEVEIEVYSAGLNFRDVLKAMGLYPTEKGEPFWLGDECAGKIAAVGENVNDLRVGEEVVAIAAGSLRKFATTHRTCVFPKPANLSFDEAATIPTVYMTTHYALNHQARLARGERILIHSAAGGVGLSALQLAQHAGAEIFATAGTPEKRDYLKSLGVKHVMDSRSQAFAHEVMELTDGKGVSVVLNSLAGEFIPNSLSVLEPTGRFLELGKIDIYQNTKLGMAHFKLGKSFFAIDLGWIMQYRPDFSRMLLAEVLAMFEAGVLRPMPVTNFPISNASTAFRYMARAKHTGKIAVSVHGTEVKVTPAPDSSPLFRKDATYLISGGLGGFNLEIGRWMVGQGARHLVLFGRRGVVSPQEEPILAGMREAGATVKLAAVDVTQPDQVSGLIEEIRQSMPPLRGVFHGAMVLDDGLVTQLDGKRFIRATWPKIAGAWNLHTATLDTPLDYFVCFSSASSLVGFPGQSNYNAGNAFLDAFAHYRRALNLPALTVNWSPIAEVGFLSRNKRIGRYLEGMGLHGLIPRDAEAILAQLLRGDGGTMGVFRADFARLATVYASPAASRRFSHILRQELPL